MTAEGTRDIFSEEHDAWRSTCRKFFAQEVKPAHAEWEEEGVVSRDVWTAAGSQGLLCPGVPEALGGAGADVLFSACVWEEQMYANCSGPGFALHSDIVAPYLVKYGSSELQARYLPAMADGSLITAIAMTEPGAGSDLRGIRTRAERSDGGWLLNGSKTYITNGWLADMAIVVARTSADGLSLFCVPSDAPGFEKGPRLRKLGMHAQDTAELFFDDVRLPDGALLGEEGRGMRYLMQELPQERLLIAAMAQASSEFMLDATRRHAADRQAFGGPLLRIKPVEHTLARVLAEVVTGRALVDDCLARHARGDLDAVLASVAKLQATEIQGRVADSCLQLHGGAGYMRDHEICRAFADARVQRIYGGANEVMLEIIGRSL